MKTLLTITVGVSLLFTSCQQQAPEKEPQATVESPEISFYTSDSVQIFGDLFEIDKAAPTILLFHQGGSNARGEYAPIIPRLTEAGYNVLAIDQRTGGQIHGSYNRTVAQIPINEFGYCDAYPDLERALDYVINAGFTGKKIAWGSSYSAALVIQLADRRPDDVAAVLAFSPASGEPMQGCEPNAYFESLKTPLLVLRPSQEMEIESVKNQFALAEQDGIQTYVAENGRHGSSMLVEARVGADVSANWDAVWAFLEQQKSN